MTATTAAAAAAAFTYSVPKVKGADGYEVVRKNTATGETEVVGTYAKRDDARAEAARSNEQAVADAAERAEADAAQDEIADLPEAAPLTDAPRASELPEEVYSLAGDLAVEQAVEQAAEQAAEQAQAGVGDPEGVDVAEALAGLSDEEVASVQGQLEQEQAHASTGAIEAAIEAGEKQAAAERKQAEDDEAAVEHALEMVLALRSLTTIPRRQLRAAIASGETSHLLEGIESARRALTERPGRRVYASHLEAGNRLEVRGVGVVTVTGVEKAGSRKVAVSYTDEAGKPGSKVSGSWQWITLV